MKPLVTLPLQGWFPKKNGRFSVRRWVQRYFILSEDGLRYFRKKTDSTPRFEASPQEILDAFYSDKQKDPTIVTIVTKKKNLLVKIVSPIGKHNWIKKLKQLRALSKPVQVNSVKIGKKNYVEVGMFMQRIFNQELEERKQIPLSKKAQRILDFWEATSVKTVIAPLFYKWVHISKQAFEIIKIESKVIPDDDEPLDDFESSSEQNGEEEQKEEVKEKEVPTQQRGLKNMVQIIQSVFGAHFRCLEYLTNPELNKAYTNPKEVSMSEMIPKEPMSSGIKRPAGS